MPSSLAEPKIFCGFLHTREINFWTHSGGGLTQKYRMCMGQGGWFEGPKHKSIMVLLYNHSTMGGCLHFLPKHKSTLVHLYTNFRQKISPAAGKILKNFACGSQNTQKFRLRRPKYSKKFACRGQNTQKISPVAGKIFKRFRLRRAKYSKNFTCGGQNTQKISPAAGKILERFRLRQAK